MVQFGKNSTERGPRVTQHYLRRRHHVARRDCGSSTATLEGKPISGVGHLVACPQCKGTFPILPDVLGRRIPHAIDGRNTAVEGMRTACGATLIASQSNSSLSDDGEGQSSTGGAVAAAAAALPLLPTPTLCLECLVAAAKSGATMVMRG